MVSPLRIIFAGSGEFGLPALRALMAQGHQIVTVYTQPDRPAGRGKKLTPTPVAALATDLGLPVVRTADINAETLPIADLMIVIAFGQKIGPVAVAHPRLGSVNLHSSRLPKYRGAAPINWAILQGDIETGNSIIRLAAKMDAGAILAQSLLPIGESETAGELHDRLANDGAPLMLKLIEELAAGTANEVEQDHAQATVPSKLSRQLSEIDWSTPANVVARQINGLSPWPGCRVKLMEGETTVATVTLIRARPGKSTSDTLPGGINADGTVTAGDRSTVQVIDLQPEGKKPMSLDSFKNGRPWKVGMRIAPCL